MNDPRTPQAAPGIRRIAIRGAVRAVQMVRRCWWFVRRPVTFGVRAIALTPAGRVILVRHSYIAGWHCPGGGRRREEDPGAAVLRELREEIGMTGHGAVKLLDRYRHRPDFKRDTVSLFLIEDVTYDFAPSLEIEAAADFAIDALPDSVKQGTVERIAAAVAQWKAERTASG